MRNSEMDRLTAALEKLTPEQRKRLAIELVAPELCHSSAAVVEIRLLGVSGLRGRASVEEWHRPCPPIVQVPQLLQDVLRYVTTQDLFENAAWVAGVGRAMAAARSASASISHE